MAIEDGIPEEPSVRADRRPVPWTGRDTLLAFVTGFFTAIGFVALAVVAAAGSQPQDGVDFTTPGWGALLTMGLYASLGASVWFFALRRHRAPWTAIGLRPATRIQLLAMIPLGIAVLIANLILVWLLARFLTDVGTAQQDAFAPGGTMTTRHYLILLVTVAGVAPVAEELLFRGMLYGYLRSRFRVLAAAGISSLVFAAAHLLPTLIPPLFFVGVVLALVVERTCSLYPAMLLHSVNNGLALTAIYLASGRA
ncbi:MAG: lysostaphin resistance A-like protein [Actinomycetota bacterium]